VIVIAVSHFLPFQITPKVYNGSSNTNTVGSGNFTNAMQTSWHAVM